MGEPGEELRVTGSCLMDDVGALIVFLSFSHVRD